MKPAIAAAFLLVSWMPAYAGNKTCWGDNSQTNISCHELGERFLMSMRGATQAEVRRAMGVDGRGGAGGSLSFMSLYTTERRGGGGTVIFHFDERGRVVTFDAFVEHANSVGRDMEMIWSPTLLPGGHRDAKVEDSEQGLTLHPSRPPVAPRQITAR